MDDWRCVWETRDLVDWLKSVGSEEVSARWKAAKFAGNESSRLYLAGSGVVVAIVEQFADRLPGAATTYTELLFLPTRNVRSGESGLLIDQRRQPPPATSFFPGGAG